MNLKTLKDLEPKDTDCVSRKELKQEAIKDIKELRKNFKHGTFNFSCDVQDNLEEYIKWKFDIIEDDLFPYRKLKLKKLMNIK